MKRLLVAAGAAWILRWAAMEIAAYAEQHWRASGPPPKDSLRRPGWMPGPFDR